MNSRISLFRSVSRISPRLGLSALRSAHQARSYATAGPGKLLVNFVVPHESILHNAEVTQVNLVSTDGEIGILADHVPTIAQLEPGVIEIISNEKPKKFFVSGGFAIMNPDSSLNINAVEAVPLEDIDFDAARRAAEEATRKISSTSDAVEKVSAQIELSVYEAIQYAAAKK